MLPQVPEEGGGQWRDVKASIDGGIHEEVNGEEGEDVGG